MRGKGTLWGKKDTQQHPRVSIQLSWVKNKEPSPKQLRLLSTFRGKKEFFQKKSFQKKKKENLEVGLVRKKKGGQTLTEEKTQGKVTERVVWHCQKKLIGVTIV